ncbi:DsbA family oxidoreductase [Haloferax mediterranei ATCC 33500]|uniref:DSBA oxidoreductase n=1 Tax=Haloferax mediterranei (strain ATCC 33500 / DSM 1411 / JCM 8866 / NBRC 14739 / NCIMB 2177 / R-4) TaxID=523841 RepID=I3R7T3_HALMT|nr:DsbA family oxidoreductase [Haloferax mediterranei]AFK20293.1 thioredoxin [Haloferax mediterranei ATCC 33500]AHZ23662.1 DSBA oxidoreductase [Haloferax mediterranei ATCC 33500]ELZ99149.1 thioredoxin [Haloferax mediterranei ATCC 33500]MDX5986952.1 DsbA family oxidoreductase [Haloferax mediterranei ATCC 33500]QCQ76271.1 DsbA family oxidoreductase [Haloferax mediterranei ATCC 33500]
MSETDPDYITIYSDYVCPFCYLGRESLKRYQETREDELDIDWHPFDLRSHKRRPDGSIDFSVDDGKDDEYFEQAKQGVRRLQEKYGVDMTLDIATDIDSLPAQVASYYVKQHYDTETWLAFDVSIFDALWQDGADIGDEELLVELAEDAGIEGDEIRSALDDDALFEEVHEQFAEAQRHGVTGVPTFAYDGYAARGAVPPEQLERLVEGF